jgi:hypothetical protein
MFVWETVRLRTLRDDLDAETRRRHGRFGHPRETLIGAQDGLELVDFERDLGPNSRCVGMRVRPTVAKKRR